jgi:hypothetical protein
VNIILLVVSLASKPELNPRLKIVKALPLPTILREVLLTDEGSQRV